jgi:hypothetical protein
MSVIRVPPIAGIAIEHHVPEGLQFRELDVPEWTGTAETEAPIIVRHQVASISTEGFARTFDALPWCHYLSDPEGVDAIQFNAVASYAPAQLLTTVRPGYEYTMAYEAIPTEPIVQWGRDRTIFTLGIAERRGGLIAHACGFLMPGGEGVLCPGLSDDGKSTLGALMARVEGVRVLSDDRVLVTTDTDRARIWGTPWSSDARIAVPGEGPLRTIAFLRHGLETSVRRVEPSDAMRRLLNMMMLPLWNRRLMDGALGLLDHVLTRVPAVELTYPPTLAAAQRIVQILEERCAND